MSVTTEISKYIPHVQSKIKEGFIIDSLVYSVEHGKDCPILSRVASQVFAVEATSWETERIATDAGIYYSKLCSRLKRETVKKTFFKIHLPQRRRAKVATESLRTRIYREEEPELRAKLTRKWPARPKTS